MSVEYIYETVERVIKKYNTRNPYELLSKMGAVVYESESFEKLKGYCFYANRSNYVVCNSNLDEHEKKVVLAHEAAHLILHKEALKKNPIKELHLYNAEGLMEYEANLFAADFLIADGEVEELCEYLDFFEISRRLCISPDLLLFKLSSMKKRGHKYSLPKEINSSFLKKNNYFDI